MATLATAPPGAIAVLVLVLIGAPCWACASGNWGIPGNVVAGRTDQGPPQRCLPPPSPPNLEAPYDVFDQLLFNGLGYLVARSGAQPLFANMNAFSLAAWNAIAPYDCSALPAIDTGIPRRPSPQRTQINRNRAVAAALVRIQELVDPPLAALSRQLMSASTPAGAFLLAPPGCSAPGTSKYNTPECVGIRAAEVTYAFAQANGWNADGSRTRSFNKAQYEDYINYVPKNTPWELTHQCKWQPLHETDGRGKVGSGLKGLKGLKGPGVVEDGSWTQANLMHAVPPRSLVLQFWIQYPLLSYLKDVGMTLINKTAEIGRTAPMWDCENPAVYKAEVDEILAYSAALNDTTKTITEFIGGLPWWLFAMQQLRQHKNWSTTDLFAFNLVQVLQVDAGVIVLKEKIRNDAVRPASAVRWLYGGSNVTAYGGPAVGGTVSLPAEWLQLWQGGSATISPPIVYGWPAAGCSLREPEMSPSGPTFFSLSSMAQFRQTCQDARVIGGVHFRAGVTAGDQMCDGLVSGAWPKIQQLYPKLAGNTC
ncbi:hypothetical protein HYH03_001607 [Edaphochlamys debaryana]|uniref:Uncharacterized protein n=1 Tax=Edaphochlamys debaryana TaxID=47281 RepID=A0A836C542_9CHLO|nr:hypothetical protein HYH03_001607 [Edaphochlamys debaryana]|eukprot:KAG2500846.1 hypothetical protein HYH03_001607 [Edaphochlamys debaryana]